MPRAAGAAARPPSHRTLGTAGLGRGGAVRQVSWVLRFLVSPRGRCQRDVHGCKPGHVQAGVLVSSISVCSTWRTVAGSASGASSLLDPSRSGRCYEVKCNPAVIHDGSGPAQLLAPDGFQCPPAHLKHAKLHAGAQVHRRLPTPVLARLLAVRTGAPSLPHSLPAGTARHSTAPASATTPPPPSWSASLTPVGSECHNQPMPVLASIHWPCSSDHEQTEQPAGTLLHAVQGHPAGSFLHAGPCSYPANAYSNKRWCCGGCNAFHPEQLASGLQCRQPAATCTAWTLPVAASLHAPGQPSAAGDMDHMDMAVWALEKLADKKWGVIGIQFRAVPCSFRPANPAPPAAHPTPGGWVGGDVGGAQLAGPAASPRLSATPHTPLPDSTISPA